MKDEFPTGVTQEYVVSESGEMVITNGPSVKIELE